MTKHLPCVVFLIVVAGSIHAQEPKRTATVAKAIEVVSKPARGFGGMSPFELQTAYRLANLRNYERGFYYVFQDSDQAKWKSLLNDVNASMYARMCAAYFLIDKDESARKFLQASVKSDNLRHRYNAAKVVDMYCGRDPSRVWGIDLLLELVGDGSLDGSGVRGSPRGEYPEGDRDDIMGTPLDEICWDFGFMKLRKTVPVLINVLKQHPNNDGAAFALGEIGDPAAIPVLLKLLSENQRWLQNREIEALGKLKSREAVPPLIDRLKSTPEDDTLATEAILAALLEIGDRRAIQPVEAYLNENHDKKSIAVAKRVLVQLKSEDPVAGLLALLAAETYEPEASDIIAALGRRGDSRAVAEFDRLARSSNSAFIRREAIGGLATIGTRDALLSLASLLDVEFSNDLKAEWGWKGLPDFRTYFPELIIRVLQRKTVQTIGNDQQKWEQWIKANMTK